MLSIAKTPAAAGIVLILLFCGSVLAAPAAAAPVAAAAGEAAAPQAAAPADSITVLQKIERDVAAVCDSLAALLGYPLEKPVPVALQPQAEFEAYIQMQLDRQYSKERRDGFVQLASTLGLLPPDVDFEALVASLYSSQAAAYYDPERKTFFLLMEDLDPSILQMISAHELTHAFQDQHYDLQKFVFDPVAQEQLSGDEELARQFVVEGQATWTMTVIYTRGMGMAVPLSFFGPAFELQSRMPYEQMLEQFRTSSSLLGEDLAGAATAAADLPRVLLEPLLLAYNGGAAFYHQVFTAAGRAGVDSLFSRPPTSSEQVLHPDLFWPERDEPQSFAPGDRVSLDGLELVPGGRIVLTDVMGEMLVRVYFQEHGLSDRAEDLAAGWDGDLVVAARDADDRPVLVWWTVWDTVEDAAEFAQGFRESLGRRFPEAATASEAVCTAPDGSCWFVEQRGSIVHVGGGLQAARLAAVRQKMGAVVPRAEP
jgi:hypothetical protein